VAVLHVGDLVAEDHRKLVLGLEARQQPGMHVERPVRKRERVCRRLVDHAHAQVSQRALAQPRILEAGRHVGQIVGQQRVVVQRHPAEHLALLLPGLVPEPLLVARRLEVAPGGRDRWEVGRRAGSDEDGDEGGGDRTADGGGEGTHRESSHGLALLL